MGNGTFAAIFLRAVELHFVEIISCALASSGVAFADARLQQSGDKFAHSGVACVLGIGT